MTDTEPTQPTPSPSGKAALRVSDSERDLVATRIREAATEGRLTMPEADERLAAAYAAVTRADLVPLTADLPEPPPAPPTPVPLSQGARFRLAVHAAVIAVFVLGMVGRWVLAGFPFFFPLFPMLFLSLTLLVHYRIAKRRSVTAPPTPLTL